MKYFYIKNNNNRYWHKNKRRWFDKRESVPPFDSLEKVYKHISDPTHEINKYYKDTEYKIVVVELSPERVVEGLRVNIDGSGIYKI